MQFDGKQLIKKIPRLFWETKYRNHLNLFLACMGISVFIWLMIKLSNEYTDTLPCNIRLVHDGPSHALINSNDSIISLTIKAQGFRLFSLKYLRPKHDAIINLNRTRLHKSRYTSGSYVLTETLKRNIAAQLHLDESLEKINPDTLFIIVEQITQKTVPLLTNFTLEFEKQYQLYGDIKLKPDSVSLTGPFEMIDTISYLQLSPLELQDLNSTQNLNVKIPKPLKSNKLSLSSESVNITIPIEKFTESVIELPIEIKHEKRKLIRLFPEKASLTYWVALKDFQKVSKDMFTIAVIPDTVASHDRILPIEITHHPTFVKNMQLSPRQVEYIILK